jgi:hypothetical protein
MRVDICDRDDEAAFAQFNRILRDLGSTLVEDSAWAMTYRIGTDTLFVFRGPSSIEIEGPDELVKQIVGKVTFLA